MFNLIVAYFNLMGQAQDLDHAAMCALEKDEQDMYARRADRAIDLVSRIRGIMRLKWREKMEACEYGDPHWVTLMDAHRHYDLWWL